MHRNWVLVHAMIISALFITGGGGDLYGQDGDSPPESPITFRLGVTFGVNSFVDEESGDIDTYQLLSLRPDIAYGKVGVGLDLPINYRFTAGDGSDFEVRREDWIPDSDRTFAEVYLPKFRYVRYGEDGDPLYLRFGGLASTTLGNGFIMNGYSNELYAPQRRVFGGVVEIDGDAFGVPYVGLETMTANMATWDVMGGRLYLRPLVSTALPLVSSFQVGSTFVVDRDPYYYDAADPSTDTVIVWGVDAQQPLISSPMLSLALIGDAAFQKDRRGTMVGLTGKSFGFLLFGGQLRFLDANFVPQYFDNIYDVRRTERYQVYDGEATIPGSVGWNGRLGFTALNDGFVFDTSVSGSFNPEPGSYPTLQSVLTISEGVVPGFSGFSVQGSYTRFDLRRWDDLADVENAVIGARFNIRSGPVVISLTYDLTYDPDAGADPWVVTSGLESTITF